MLGHDVHVRGECLDVNLFSRQPTPVHTSLADWTTFTPTHLDRDSLAFETDQSRRSRGDTDPEEHEAYEVDCELLGSRLTRQARQLGGEYDAGPGS